MEEENNKPEVMEEEKVMEEVKIVEPEKRPDEAELLEELARIRSAAENQKKNNTAKIIGIVIVAVLTVVLLTLGTMALRKSFGDDKKGDNTGGGSTEQPIVSGQTIKLDEYREGVSITAGGEYNLTGRIDAPVIVDSLEDVTLRLNGATIEVADSSAIASVGEGTLTIELVKGTENNLRNIDDGEYDGCIFARGPLTITGDGTLSIETTDEGINAEHGYVIDSGTIAVLGSDMPEVPKSSSKQNVLIFDLSDYIASGTLVTLTDNDNGIVIAFTARESFQTLMISTPKLTKGAYKLYTGGSINGKIENGFYNDGILTGGSAVTVDNTAVFTVNNAVTTISNSRSTSR